MDGFLSFDHKWTNFSTGFGNPHNEFFIGLEKLHLLTKLIGKRYRLRVDLTYTSGNKSFAEYGKFSIGSESDSYSLSISRYSTRSTAGKLIKFTNIIGNVCCCQFDQ